MKSTLPLRSIFLLALSTFIYGQSSAQVLQKGFAAGVHLGLTQPFTDVVQSDVNPNFGASVQYNATTFTFINAEFSNGKFARKDVDKHGKSYSNSSNRISATANVSLGQFLRPKRNEAHQLLYNIYAGTGAGVIMSNISEPNMVTFDGQGGVTYKGSDFIVPINLGLNFRSGGTMYNQSPLFFNVNLQHNFTFTEMLDGYNPANADNKTKDSFTTLNFGIKYAL